MSELLVRRFDAALEADGDGRTIVGRCVPYDVEATVSDPDRPPYREIWRVGAFRHVLKAPQRVRLNYEHEDRSILNVVGHAVDLEERDDGLHGTFRALGTPGDQALELIAAGTVRGLSVAVRMHERGSKAGEGFVERIRVSQLDHVALTSIPAYLDATVMAVRSEDEPAGTPILEEALDWIARTRAKFPVRS